MKTEFLLKNVHGYRTYQGCNGYHESHTESDHNYMDAGGTSRCPYWVGVELEVECNTSECRDWLEDGVKSNWFYIETDGSLRNYGREIITIRMKPKVAYSESTWYDLLDKLKELGATSHDNGRCGIHVHVSRTGFGATEEEQDETLAKVFHMYHNELGASGNSPVNYVNILMRRSYSDYCRSIMRGIDREKLAFFDFASQVGFKAIDKKFRKSVVKGISKPQRERYDAINRQSNATIEFRQGKGTLLPSSLCATVEFVCTLVNFCRVNTFEKCTRQNFEKVVKALPKNSCLRNKLYNRVDR